MANEEKKSSVAPLIVTNAAIDAVKRVRVLAEKEFGMRPDLALVATAMLRLAERDPKVVEEIRAVALETFAGKEKVVAASA